MVNHSTSKLFQSKIILILVALICQHCFSADWPHYLGPNNNKSDETNLIKSWPVSGPRILWTVDVGLGFGGAAIRDNEVFILDRIDDRDDTIRCLNLDSGVEKWNYTNVVPGRLPYPGSRSVPTVTEKFVYSISCLGDVYCIDRAKQSLVWHIDIKENYNVKPARFGFAQSPVIYKNMIFIAPMSASRWIKKQAKKYG